MGLGRYYDKAKDKVKDIASDPFTYATLGIGPGIGATYAGLRGIGMPSLGEMFGGGGGEGGGSVAPSSYEEALAMMALDQYNSTRGLRQGFLQQYTDLMTGHLDPSQMPQYAPAFAQGKEAIEDQYGLAREGIISNAPRGGAMQGQLADLESSRAEQASTLPMMLAAGITEDMMNKAYGTSFQTAPQLAMGGMGTAAGTLSNRLSAQIAAQAAERQAQAAERAAMWGGIGSLVGTGITAGFMGGK